MSSEKIKRFFSRQEFIYTLFIVLAFALLVFLCSWFMGHLERKHIMNDAKSALDTTELNINSDLQKIGRYACLFIGNYQADDIAGCKLRNGNKIHNGYKRLYVRQ